MHAERNATELVACGEVRTCLLQTSESLPIRSAGQLLQSRPDDRVRISERPNLYAESANQLVGVDCALPSASNSRVRGVGTVQTRAVLTEGRVLQATAHFLIPAGVSAQRLPWGHYLARPGLVELMGRTSDRDVAEGFLTGRTAPPGTLDLGSIAERTLGGVLAHTLLDRRPPFKSQRTRLRWTAVRAEVGKGPSLERFTLAEDGLRMVALRLPDLAPAPVVSLCEDLALHDWLLTTLIRMIERSRLGTAADPQSVMALRPAVDHLLHLWMPQARVARSLAPLWDVLEREPGLSRQWQTLVQRIRDQLALQAITLLCRT